MPFDGAATLGNPERASNGVRKAPHGMSRVRNQPRRTGRCFDEGRDVGREVAFCSRTSCDSDPADPAESVRRQIVRRRYHVRQGGGGMGDETAVKALAAVAIVLALLAAVVLYNQSQERIAATNAAARVQVQTQRTIAADNAQVLKNQQKANDALNGGSALPNIFSTGQ